MGHAVVFEGVVRRHQEASRQARAIGGKEVDFNELLRKEPDKGTTRSAT